MNACFMWWIVAVKRHPADPCRFTEDRVNLALSER